MYEKLPDDLKRNARFCLWKYETRKGKPTKVPYRTDGRRADSSKASDFSSFDAVTSVLKKGGYDGIGIMVGGGFSAVDIDNCVTDGKLTETAQDIVDTMDSYTETSPSGTGIRIVFNADGAEYDKARYHNNLCFPKYKHANDIRISPRTLKMVRTEGDLHMMGLVRFEEVSSE